MKIPYKRSGMALVIVMAFSIALLTLGGAYLSSFSKQVNQNTIELGAVQADLLAEGITQIAMLKLKELPAPLYYATLCQKAPNGGEAPYNTFCNDSEFNGRVTASIDGFTANYSTTIQCLPTKLYETMNAKVTVVLSLERNDKRNYDRVIERVVSGDRKVAN